MSKKLLIPIEIDSGIADTGGLKLIKLLSTSPTTAGSAIGVDAVGNVVRIAASGASGSTTVNFGAFPGASDASVAVTGQAGIVAGSTVNAWMRPLATADHTADEHIYESIKIVAGNIVAGTGFTIYALNTSGISEPTGKGTRLYGLFTVSWSWS